MKIESLLKRFPSGGHGLRLLAALLGLVLAAPVGAQYVEDLAQRSIIIANLGESAMLSMQLLAARAQNKGDVPSSVVDCIKALDKASYDPLLSIALAENLDREEIAAAEAFFSSDLGRKYARHGLLQVYEAAGMEPPEAYPEFSEVELAALEEFSRTAAGDKLLVKKVLAKAPVRKAMESLTQELLAGCRARPVQR